MRRTLLFILAFATIGSQTWADEPTRCVQEELRKRNLYFGDIDGRKTIELTGALKRYQARKNLEVTGEIDQETANSLNVPGAVTPKAATQQWPELPVLKSDAARDLPEPERLALEQKAEQGLDATASPAAPAESPSNAQNLTPERVTKLVEDYLRDAEGDDVDLQVRYYSSRVNYFDHGNVGREFVTRDTRNYVKRWPKRKYLLTAPVTFAAGKDDETNVQFSIAFTVKNEKQNVTGRTRNYWTIKPEKGDDLKIVTIREERFRE
jgi:hypothetical protein